ncbi:MAG: right-handed parallel beta-helix repeat-containing protein [Verrucomicrobiae bacterium]|nr:right-handed parallel beta-helix repeat-containing protein [Verrucomicrobiae bacterium]
MKTPFFLLLLAPLALGQGPLLPPGAPAPSMRSLAQIEPRVDLATLPGDATHQHVITAAGSYYLSGNLEVWAPGGVRIQSSDVTLDLQGFCIRRSSGTGGSGIEIAPAVSRVAIGNGGISGFEHGVKASGSGSSLVFRRLRFALCATRAILASSNPGCRVSDCSVSNGGGISVGPGSIIGRCRLAGVNAAGGSVVYGSAGSVLQGITIVSSSADSGIFVNEGSTLRDCTIQNSTFAAAAVHGAKGCAIHGCLVAGNSTAHGILVNDNGLVKECIVRANTSSATSYGIGTGPHSTIEDCIADGNTMTYGIHSSEGSALRNCSATRNTFSAAGSSGIQVYGNCALTGCHALGNLNTSGSGSASDGVGIMAASGGNTIRDCVATGNQGHGIHCSGGSNLLTGNSCANNGAGGALAAGILLAGNGSRLEGNHTNGGPRGIWISGSGNLASRNSVAGATTAYIVTSGNACLVVAAAVTSSSLSGSSGGVASGTTDPWANLSY